MLHKTVAVLLVLTFFGTVRNPNLLRKWLKTQAIGTSGDATSEHTHCTLLFGGADL